MPSRVLANADRGAYSVRNTQGLRREREGFDAPGQRSESRTGLTARPATRRRQRDAGEDPWSREGRGGSPPALLRGLCVGGVEQAEQWSQTGDDHQPRTRLPDPPEPVTEAGFPGPATGLANPMPVREAFFL